MTSSSVHKQPDEQSRGPPSYEQATHPASSSQLPSTNTTHLSRTCDNDEPPAYESLFNPSTDESLKAPVEKESLAQSEAKSSSSSSSCAHWLPRRCQLTTTEKTCCACVDRRPNSDSDRCDHLIDGLDLQESSVRWQHYCQGCKSYFETWIQPNPSTSSKPMKKRPYHYRRPIIEKSQQAPEVVEDFQEMLKDMNTSSLSSALDNAFDLNSQNRHDRYDSKRENVMQDNPSTSYPWTIQDERQRKLLQTQYQEKRWKEKNAQNLEALSKDLKGKRKMEKMKKFFGSSFIQ